MEHEELRRAIEDAYLKFGFRSAWSFLYSSLSTLDKSDTVFLGLNPGGSGETFQPEFSSETCSAYEEEWQHSVGKGSSPLQLQVKALFCLLQRGPNEVLSGNFVPFRSRDWNTMQASPAMYAEVLAFARQLWAPILLQRPFRIVVMGRACETQVCEMMDAEFVEALPTGWGKITARFYAYPRGEICALPHLSRYRIFDRPEMPGELETRISGLRAHQEFQVSVG